MHEPLEAFGMNFGKLTGNMSRLGAVLVVAAALGGCSILPDWLGGDSDTSTADSTPAPDQTADANASYPDLADTPDRPAAPSTADDQKKVADSLGSARAQQDYNTEQLHAGAETAAAPPPAEAPQEDLAEVDTGSKAPPETSSDADSDTGSSAPASTGTTEGSANTPATPSPAPTTAVASNPAPAMNNATSGAPAVPAVPPLGSSVMGAQPPEMTDSQLGFQPSKAPPLDVSVAQFVPQPILSRYRQTASVSSTSAVSTGPAVPAVPPAAPYSGPAMGGPEQMSGAVVANFDSLQGGAVGPSVMASASGMPSTASILFPHDTTILTPAAKLQVEAAAQAFNAQGGTGYIRVVGHASSRTANMSVSRHLQWDFDHSQARANSVARALIAAGVPASKVLISAVGDDNQSDEETSRRADIFIQS
jgi:outer membrane protein OmpA-like peptidoglycan-associated protein